MKREILFSTGLEDSAVLDSDRVVTMLNMLNNWADPPRPKNKSKIVPGQDYEPTAIGRIKGNLFSAADVRMMDQYVRKLLGRGRAWIAEQRLIETSPQAQFMMDQAETHFGMIERMLTDYVEAFWEAEREQRLDDLPSRHAA